MGNLKMSDQDDVVQADERAQMEEAFSASFNDKEVSHPVVKKVKEEKPEVKAPEAKATPEAPPEPVLSAEQKEILELRKLVDKVAGNYGEIKRNFDAQKSATAQAAAAIPTQENPQGLNPEQLREAIVEARKAEIVAETERAAAIVLADHPDIDLSAMRDSEEWAKWGKTMKPWQFNKIVNSSDPYFVSESIDAFKAWKSAQQAKAEKSKQRIESAVQPTGSKSAGSSTLSEAEEMQAAFDAQFK